MKFEQSPHALLMVRPSRFGFNPETDASNAFQHQQDSRPEEISALAQEEFDGMVEQLRFQSIDVRVFDDTETTAGPDSVFPNNWISFQPDGTIVLYPMMVQSRRRERRTDIIDILRKDFFVGGIIDISGEEQHGRFLEGTGSIVFDHASSVAFACRSARTDAGLFLQLCDRINYKAIVFDAVDQQGRAFYHTNVMMSIGKTIAVVCLDAIRHEQHQEIIINHLHATGRKIVAIGFEQVKAFAGNMLEVTSQNGESCMIVSDTALHSLLPGQVNALSNQSAFIPLSVPTIQRYGGGGVRCMVAGVHLQRLR